MSACAEWILSFVQEMGVRSDMERGWSTQQNLFLSSLSLKQRLVLDLNCFCFLCYPNFIVHLCDWLSFDIEEFFSMQFLTVNLR